jgi:hypothetical protein
LAKNVCESSEGEDSNLRWIKLTCVDEYQIKWLFERGDEVFDTGEWSGFNDKSDLEECPWIVLLDGVVKQKPRVHASEKRKLY